MSRPTTPVVSEDQSAAGKSVQPASSDHQSSQSRALDGASRTTVIDTQEILRQKRLAELVIRNVTNDGTDKTAVLDKKELSRQKTLAELVTRNANGFFAAAGLDYRVGNVWITAKDDTTTGAGSVRQGTSKDASASDNNSS